MSRETISAVLQCLAEADFEEHPAFDAFCERMKPRELGARELDTAWCWFSAGWNDCQNLHDKVRGG